MTGTDAVTRFERAFADWIGTETAFAFWKARVGLYAILRAIGLGTGDEVILPGYTCVMDVNPIKYVGAKPVYGEVEPARYNVLPEEIEKKITPRTRLIIAQHTYGFPCEMDEILDIASRHGIPVVEDCCLALGSTYKGKMCGTFGLAAYWSFQWNKPFTTGLGGMIATSDRELAGKIEAVREEELLPPSTKSAFVLAAQRAVYRTCVYPRTTALARSFFRWLTRKGLVIGSSSTAEYVPEMPEDFFMGMSASQARAGLKQIRKLPRNLAHRRKMRFVYEDLLRRAGWEVPEIPDYIDPVLVLYPVRVSDKKRAITEAPRHFVELGTWFECPLHPIETPLHLYDYEYGMCPVAERACREVVNLPTHPRANYNTAQRTVRFICSIGRP